MSFPFLLFSQESMETRRQELWHMLLFHNPYVQVMLLPELQFISPTQTSLNHHVPNEMHPLPPQTFLSSPIAGAEPPEDTPEDLMESLGLLSPSSQLHIQPSCRAYHFCLLYIPTALPPSISRCDFTLLSSLEPLR